MHGSMQYACAWCPTDFTMQLNGHRGQKVNNYMYICSRGATLASFPGFTRALVLRPIRNAVKASIYLTLVAFLIGLSTSAWVKSGNKASAT